MANLVTLAEVQTRLGLDQESPVDTSKNDLINQLIAAMSAAVEGYCQTRFAQESPPETITEKLNGSGKVLVLKHRPVLTFTSLSDRWDSPGTIAATSYEVDEGAGLIYRTVNDRVPSGQEWGEGTRRYEAVYTYGYSTCPNDVKQATLRWIEQVMRPAGINSEQLGDYSYTMQILGAMSEEKVPRDIARLLAPYVQKGRLYFEG